MAVRYMVARAGIGFKPGSILYLITHGLNANPPAAVTPDSFSWTLYIDQSRSQTRNIDKTLSQTRNIVRSRSFTVER